MKSFSQLNNNQVKNLQKNNKPVQFTSNFLNFYNMGTKKAELRSYTAKTAHFHINVEKNSNLKGKKGVFFDANGVLYHRRANKIITLQNYLISKGFDPCSSFIII